jgi:hypothetical protein
MMEEDQKITPLRLKAQKTSFLDYRVATSPMYLVHTYKLPTYLLDVLWCQPIKLIHVVCTSEFLEY